MLVCMDPSSPPVKRTLHLLKTPDILCANDNRPPVSYYLSNNWEEIDLVLNFRTEMSASAYRDNAQNTAKQAFIEAQCEFRSSRADVVEFVAVKALQNDAKPQTSIAWPQRIQSKTVIFTRFQ